MRTIFLLLLSFISLAAQEFKPGAAQPFQSGDTVCYVGDSITHGGSYHAIVTLFYTTRYPDRDIKYYNNGIGGGWFVALTPRSDGKFTTPGNQSERNRMDHAANLMRLKHLRALSSPVDSQHLPRWPLEPLPVAYRPVD